MINRSGLVKGVIQPPLSGEKAILALFKNGEQGVWYDPSDMTQEKLTYRRNLLTYSEQFGNAVYSKVRATITDNSQTAPDGTTTADSFVEDTTATSTHAVLFPAITFTSGITYTVSIYVKAVDRTSVALLLPSAAFSSVTQSVYFNLSNNTVYALNGATSASITADANGFVRISVTATATAASGSSIILYSAIATSNVLTGSGTTSFYLWGAQFETGAVVTPYQKITDYNTEFIANFPNHSLFQDTSGVTAVTAVGQPVGLMLDKSKSLALGVERLTNQTWVTPPSFDSTTSGTGSSVTVTGVTTASRGAVAISGLTIGSSYIVNFFVASTSSALIAYARDGSTAGTGTILATSGSYTTGQYGRLIFTATSSDANLLLSTTVASNFSVNGISLQSLAGNHATQATAASRPVLSARVNMFTKTDSFVAPWGVTGANSSAFTPVAAQVVDGVITAVMVFRRVGATGFEGFQQAITLKAGIPYTASFKVRIPTGVTAGELSIYDGSVNSVVASAAVLNAQPKDVWVSRSVTFTPSLDRALCSFNNSTAAGVGTGFDIAVPHLETGLVATRYQRVNTATDYDTIGFPMYLSCDGVDDGMATASIDFSGTDKVTMWAGVRKLSDAATSIVLELGVGVIATTSFNIVAPLGAAANYAVISYASTTSNTITATTFTAPASNVITSSINNAATTASEQNNISVNGVRSILSNTGSVNADVYMLNTPLYLFKRVGSTLMFNGNCYGIVIRGATSSPKQISKVEKYLATKTGVIL